MPYIPRAFSFSSAHLFFHLCVIVCVRVRAACVCACEWDVCTDSPHWQAGPAVARLTNM